MARGRIEKRGSRKRKVKPVVLIVTEGAKTEPGYFNYFRTRQKNIGIKMICLLKMAILSGLWQMAM